MHVAFPQETFNKLVTYLGNKPFNEVENLINELKATVKPVNITTTEPPKEEGDAENVQSNEPEITQSETTAEGGNKIKVKNPKTVSSKGKTKPGY